MDLKDQLKNIFPDHVEQDTDDTDQSSDSQQIWMQEEPLLCKYEKRKGKPVTIIEGYTGADEDFKTLAKELKTMLGVGGSFKNERILIQGDYRKEIMEFLQQKGFKTKRVGG